MGGRLGSACTTLALALLLSCSSSNPTICVANVEAPCSCPNAVVGVQVCRADGSGYGECTRCGLVTQPDGGSPTTDLGSDVSLPGDRTIAPDVPAVTGDDGGMACPDAGCLPEPEVVVGAQANPTAIALDADNVYWATEREAGGIPSNGTIQQRPLAGGAVLLLTDAEDSPSALALAAGRVYWVNTAANTNEGNLSFAAIGTMRQVNDLGALDFPVAFALFPLPPAAPTSAFVGSSSTGGLTRVDFSTLGKTPIDNADGSQRTWSVAVDDTNVYWTSDSGNVLQQAILGGMVKELAMQQSLPLAVAVDANFVYWVNGAQPAQVMKLAKGGGTPMPLANDSASPVAMAIDTTHAYWVSVASGVGNVLAVALDGSGSVTTLATGQADPNAIAVNETHVYWTNFGTFGSDDGAVMRVAK